ncbi:cyclic AMP-dependent transcription factor ATF-4 [Oryzias melastigma]|uniref:Cyclic AMP-dependent transcription factor ATF-4 n=1 Tax=Oryzias melastigma TaxID=30732 RepID=A0A3B3CC68_ORYME|nr:cyclic AMP-dependent transcription factor ATF-4 [Oryzias melastigma]
MAMTLSQLALEDVEALCLGSSFLMADPIGPLLDQDEEEALSPSSSLEVKVPMSPSLSFSSCASVHSPYQTMSFSPFSPASPPCSPPIHSSFLGTKAEVDLLPFSLLGANDLLDTHDVAGDGKDDAFEDMDWMSEKVDLSEFDLDSLIDSCSPASSPEDLLASLESHVDLNLDSFEETIGVRPNTSNLGLTSQSSPIEISSPKREREEVACVQEVAEKPNRSPSSTPSSPSPSFTLELGSEVDVVDAGKTAASLAATILSDPSGVLRSTSPIVLSIPSSGHLVVVLTNKEAPSISIPSQLVETSSSSDCDSDSGIDSVAGSPPSPPTSPMPGSSRTKPYSKPQSASSSSPKAAKVKSVSGAPRVVEKKLKKMEQNKTAATRYRQKKRVEHELLNVELEELEKKNHELEEKAESISREIQYLKDLMEEVRKHRRGKSSLVA